MILLVIFLSSVFLPKIYWLIFGTRIIPSRVYYSPVTNNFMIGKMGNKKFYWEDQYGKRYTRQEGDSLLPLQNYRVLAAKGKLPDSLRGIKLDIEGIRRNNINLRVKPYYLDSPSIPLYPLFESKPPRFKLEIPEYYFRIKEGIEFISATTNQVNDSLSAVYNMALKEAGFRFPARKVFGNPTTRKPFDEGYFIIDNANQIFHLKRIHDRPFCANLHLPASVIPEWIIVKEMSLKEFYGLLITRDNRLYFILYDHYKLQPLPVPNFDPLNDVLEFNGNLFFRTFNVISGTENHSFVTNRAYALIDTLRISWTGQADTPAGKAAAYIFPFSLRFADSSSMYMDFYFTEYNVKSLIAGLFFFILTLTMMRRKFNRVKPISVLALVFGMYGFIALTMFNLGQDE